MSDTNLEHFVSGWTKFGYVCAPATVCLDGDGRKDVRIAPWRELAETPSEWDGHTGVAIVTGPSGVVVVDVDVSGDKNGWEGLREAGVTLPDTPLRVRTWSGGEHWYYRARTDIAVGTSAGVLAKDVDVRGVGGVVFAPPTMVTAGAGYTIVDEKPAVPVSSLPEFPWDLAQRLSMTAPQKARLRNVDPDPDVTDEQREWARRKIDHKLRDIAAAGDGERNVALGRSVARIAGLAKTVGEDLDAVADLVREAYEESGGTDRKQLEDWIRNAFDYAEPEDPESWLPDDRAASFWDARPELARIRQAAQAGMAAPYAVLGVLAVRVLADVPVNYRLNSGIGARGGNLNLYVALAAESGGGKGVATDVAEYLYPNDVYSTEVASGEALPTLFARKVKGEQEWVRTSAVVTAPEFSSLRASGDRSGSTLVGRLCAAFSGEALSFAKADSDRNVDVGANTYRLGLITGIQYANSGMLLSDDATGTGLPQRFLWMPANDPSAPEYLPDMPSQLPVARFPVSPSLKLIRVCEEAKADIRRGRRLRLIGQPDERLDGHKLYARLKMAYALAVLNGRLDEVSLDDWRLAGIVTEVSDAARAKAVAAVAAKAARKAAQAGREDGLRKVAATESEAEETENRVRGYITRYLEKHGHGSASQLRQAVLSSLRDRAADVIDTMATEGQLAETGDGYFKLV